MWPYKLTKSNKNQGVSKICKCLSEKRETVAKTEVLLKISVAWKVSWFRKRGQLSPSHPLARNNEHRKRWRLLCSVACLGGFWRTSLCRRTFPRSSLGDAATARISKTLIFRWFSAWYEKTAIKKFPVELPCLKYSWCTHLPWQDLILNHAWAETSKFSRGKVFPKASARQGVYRDVYESQCCLPYSTPRQPHPNTKGACNPNAATSPWTNLRHNLGESTATLPTGSWRHL